MKKSLIAFLCAAILSCSISFAAPTPPDEGMWLMSLVQFYNIEQMHALGLKLSAEEIYSTNQPSLKDAVVSFGGFCTAEFVSANGMLFTNHHCGYESIASLSDIKSDYLKDGFWANSYQEEIPVPGLFVKVLVYMQDVTDSIVPKLQGLDVQARSTTAQGIIKNIIANAKGTEGYDAEVRPMFSGNQYFLFVYQTFKDIRFVGTPPESVGKYGGDTDNWMWPRHTGDFSVFRVYADKNNKPADYATDNIAYKPKKFLPISLKGFTKGDYSMTIGYPASTSRYVPSFAVNDVIQNYNPTLVALLKNVTDVMKKYMDEDEAVRLIYAGDYANYMNSLKLWENETPRLIKEDVVNRKQKQEQDFQTWLNTQPDSVRTKYGTVLSDMKNESQKKYDAEKPVLYASVNLNFPFMSGLAAKCFALEDSLNAKSKNITEIIAGIQAAGEQTFHQYSAALQQDLLASMMKQYYDAVSADNRPATLNTILNQYGSFDAFAKEAFSKSFLTDSNRLKTFLAKPSAKVMSKDLLYQYFKELTGLRMQLVAPYSAPTPTISKYMRLYYEGIMKMNANKKFYPDANSTMRLSYGTIEDCNPRDAIHYEYQTWLSGVIEKMDNTNPEFVVPDKLYQLWKQKDFGPYAVNGDVPVCFLSDNDIIGGNSGSPVINGNGELIGLAFDGNIEGTSADYNFNPDMNRMISVDIRYVLFIIDKYANAQRVMNELVIDK